jgi:hypothetical protein
MQTKIILLLYYSYKVKSYTRPILYDQAKSMTQVAIVIIKVWRCQRGNDKVYIKGRTIKWQREKGQKDKTMFHKTPHRKLSLSNTNPTIQRG